MLKGSVSSPHCSAVRFMDSERALLVIPALKVLGYYHPFANADYRTKKL
jgi:hypothetical protein